MKFGIKNLETSLYRKIVTYFDILNSLDMAHECDRQMDRQHAL